MFNPSRQEARQFFFDAWRKHREGQLLTPLESMTLDVTLMHPEYHAILDDAEKYMDRDYSPELGETNPFMHMSMHLAINEQLSIDQPPGIRSAFDALCAQQGNAHDALHEVMDCLGEMIWQAQRTNTAPDGALYLGCLKRKIRN
ncbi:MAG: DUF1841 family protein [Pseudomonadota bacterium]